MADKIVVIYVAARSETIFGRTWGCGRSEGAQLTGLRVDSVTLVDTQSFEFFDISDYFAAVQLPPLDSCWVATSFTSLIWENVTHV